VVIGQQIKLGTPEMAMYGFAVFYALCLVLELVVLPARQG
jgi:NNP family nitrate/nitrite transporter-like MFS transporter